ncbi:MAG TPA: glycerol-3-phosphate acyltransferase [Clostridia bacterium]|nr:glycerol-3-phosphate acyltransferase [Clostridia bacterium]
MSNYFLFIFAGFISGSIMYSYLIAKIFYDVDIIEQGEDHNPGTTNVMRCVSVKLGILCMILDVLKGMVPVLIALRFLDTQNKLFAIVIAAPVLGHAFSPFLKFRGGKAIASTFGVFLGLSTLECPIVLLLALPMAFFSAVMVIKPDSLRVIISMVTFAAIGMALPMVPPSYALSAVIITATVVFKHIINFGDEKASFKLFFIKK